MRARSGFLFFWRTSHPYNDAHPAIPPPPYPFPEDQGQWFVRENPPFILDWKISHHAAPRLEHKHRHTENFRIPSPQSNMAETKLVASMASGNIFHGMKKFSWYLPGRKIQVIPSYFLCTYLLATEIAGNLYILAKKISESIKICRLPTMPNHGRDEYSWQFTSMHNENHVPFFPSPNQTQSVLQIRINLEYFSITHGRA